MEELFNQLKEIEDILEQISTITANQTTVLLQTTNETLGEIDILETMVGYKEELINQLETVEKSFDANYKEKREQVKSKEYVLEFKKRVANILDKKQQIQDMEQNNVRIMQSKVSRKIEKMEIAKKPNQVLAAYKKQQQRC